MSTELVKNEIRRFLSTEEPEVISVSGHWGVGKTFAWNRYLKEAQADDSIALKHYSYISLFGINSLDELRYSIFENSVNSSEIGIEPSLETLQSNTSAATKRLGRKSLWFLQQIPLVKNYVGGLGPVWFLSVKGTIVCLDDIERRGRGLSIREVLGLVSNLKEQKRCKVALILNDDALEEDKDDFRMFLEKVVDTPLKFEPTPEESVGIALVADVGNNKQLGQCCIILGISNIRVIKRIERFVRKIETMLKEYHEQVQQQAVQSLALLGWSVYEPTRAPSPDYLESRGATHFLVDKNKVVPENEAAWNALLDVYGFTRMDEFDLALRDGIRDGYFDPSRIHKHAAELSTQATASQLGSSFSSAWSMFHDSFENDQEDVLDAMYLALTNGAKYVNPINLSATVALFKELGRADQAAAMIKQYVAIHGEDGKMFDLKNYPFAEDIKDPDVVQAFAEKYAVLENKPDPAAILRAMAETKSWNFEDTKMLSTLSVDEYYKIFKGSKGRDLRGILDACLQFDRIGNASAEMKEISNRAREALKRIGQESAINALRVRRYGVKVEVD